MSAHSQNVAHENVAHARHWAETYSAVSDAADPQAIAHIPDFPATPLPEDQAGVGGSFFLPRLPGATGMYLALTGERMKAGDTCATGVTQMAMNSANIAALRQELSEQSALDHNRIDDILEDMADDPGAARIPDHSAGIDQAFRAETLDPESFHNETRRFGYMV